MSIKDEVILQDQEPRKRRKGNPEAVREWQRNHPEKMKEYARRYRQTHKKELNEYAKRYRQLNPNRVRETLARYVNKLKAREAAQAAQEHVNEG